MAGGKQPALCLHTRLPQNTGIANWNYNTCTYLKRGTRSSYVGWAKCVLQCLEFATSLKIPYKKGQDHTVSLPPPPPAILQRGNCAGRGEEISSLLPGLSALAPGGPEGARFLGDGFFTQSSDTVKKVRQKSHFYFGCHRTAVGNFIPFSPDTFLRFRKKTKSLSTACSNKGNVKPSGVGGDNNQIP